MGREDSCIVIGRTVPQRLHAVFKAGVRRRASKYDVDLGAIGLMAALAIRQTGPAPAPEIPVSIERIQRRLEQLPPIEPEPERLRIRVTIEAHPLRLRVPWDPANDTAVPNYVRPAVPLYHHEFLLAVTPEAFRGGTLYPIGVPVLAGLQGGVRAVRNAIRRSEEARVRKEVREELRKFLQAREKEKQEAEKPRP
jgi:hypothetical protein